VLSIIICIYIYIKVKLTKQKFAQRMKNKITVGTFRIRNKLNSQKSIHVYNANVNYHLTIKTININNNTKYNQYNRYCNTNYSLSDQYIIITDGRCKKVKIRRK